MHLRHRYISLLQVCGTLAIIAFHLGLRGTSAGWVAVELFFVLAGINMASAVGRSRGVIEYGRARIQRVAPELAIVWCVVALVALDGMGTPGGDWFLFSSPVFLQNLTLHAFVYQFPHDWAFGPLWFLGALLQLQLIMFVSRAVLAKSRPAVVVGIVVVLGIAFRALTAFALGGRTGDLDPRMADVLYCLPLTHIEAITLGFLVGRGSLAGIGRNLWPLAFAAIGASLVSAALSARIMPLGSLGLAFPLSTNYMHVWMYTLLAFAAAAVCSPQNPIAVRLQSIVVPAWLDAGLSRLSALSFGTYMFHGVVIALGMNMAPWFRAHGVHFAAPIVMMMTTVGALLLAQLTLSARRAIPLVGPIDVRVSGQRVPVRGSAQV